MGVIYRQHRTALSMSRKKLCNITVLLLLMVPALAGCSSSEPKIGAVCFNSHTANTYDYKSYHLYAVDSMLWVENMDTGETTELIRDPLLNAGQGRIGKNLIGDRNCFNYI